MQDNSPVFNFITHNNAKAHLWRGWGKLNILLILLLFNLCEKYTMIENHQKCWNKCILIFAPKIAKIAFIDSIANFCAKIRIVLFRKNLIFGAKFEIIFDLKMAHFWGENSNISTESYVQIVERNSSTSDSEKTQKLYEIHATLLMLFLRVQVRLNFPMTLWITIMWSKMCFPTLTDF